MPIYLIEISKVLLDERKKGSEKVIDFMKHSAILRFNTALDEEIGL